VVRWTSFAFLTIVTVSGRTAWSRSPSAADRAGVHAGDAGSGNLWSWAPGRTIVASDPGYHRVKQQRPVATEIIGIADLTVALLIPPPQSGDGHWSNSAAPGGPSSGYYAGLARSCWRRARRVHDRRMRVGQTTWGGDAEPHKVFRRHRCGPCCFRRGRVRVHASPAFATTRAPPQLRSGRHTVARNRSVVQKIFLVFVAFDLRLRAWSYGDERRRIFHGRTAAARPPVLRQGPRSSGRPSWATVRAAELGWRYRLGLLAHPNALFNLFTPRR